MKKIKPGLATRLVIFVSILLFTTYLLLGSILMSNSRSALKTLIQYRMLDIANTAADMLDGDDLASLKKEDKGTPKYQRINDTLAVFQDNIDLKYIYCVTPVGGKKFVFSVDPTVEDPGEFGTPVTYTDALYAASKGTASVDNEPYEDAWGRFYSAYSPVFDSKGNVAGIVAVDFEAQWYDEQLTKQSRAIQASTFVSILIAILLILFITSRYRRRMKSITEDLSDIILDVDELRLQIDPDSVTDTGEVIDGDDVQSLGLRIRQVKEALQQYSQNINTQAINMISALSSEYHSIYYIDLDRDEGICYQPHALMDQGLQKGEHFPYQKTLASYAELYVTEKNRTDFLHFVDPETIRANLKKDRIATFRFMVERDGMKSYEMVRMARVRKAEEQADDCIHSIGMGFADVDTETRQTLSQSQALRDALDGAQSASRAKTAFLSNMSHEIRTPMNAIIGLDRIALSEPGLPDSTRDHLEKIGTAADHLLKIINDILDMSRIEAGRMTLKNEIFSLQDLLVQVDVMIGGQCRDKGLAWHYEIGNGAAGNFIGDEVKLKQVLINILGNSVKFTPRGGQVELLVDCVSHYNGKSVFHFIMKDTGIGMDSEFLPKLFEPFSQEDISTKTKYGSTGLGMSITKSIVEMMQGDILVESEKGKGSTFTVTVTLADAAPESAALETAAGGAVDAVPGAATDGTDVAAADEADDILKGKRVLLAEDIQINAEIIRLMLTAKGILLDHAENGKIAVDMFSGQPEGYYDAILMDMRMPEMDGLEATATIRRLPRPDAKKIPIIALTANAFDDDVKRSLQAGLNAHLSKPIDPENLFATMIKFF